MLRAAFVAVLLLANLALLAWTIGVLDHLGLGAASEREPARLALQVNPDAVRVLPPAAAQAALLGASAATAKGRAPLLCLESGPLGPAALEAAERALADAGLSEGSWQRSRQERVAQFGLVLGPFASRDSLQKKREELERLRLSVETLDVPGDSIGAARQPALSLGRYADRAAADLALASLAQRGVRTARVLELGAAVSETRLRIDGASAALAEQLRTLGAGAVGPGFATCTVATTVR